MRLTSWLPKTRRWRDVLEIFAALILWLIYQSVAVPPAGPIGELIPLDESAYASQIVDAGIRMLTATRQEAGDKVYRRDAHAKTHGCVLADFSVHGNSALTAPAGIFATPHTYKAWIRYSSGSTSLQSDWSLDARGMAIKLLNVPGIKILEGEQQAQTQDFLMINNPVFFIRDVEEYAVLTRYQAQGSQFGYFFQGWNPANWKLREFRIGMGILKWPPRNLLGTQFHSMSAYRLGAAHYVKYTAKPVACNAQASEPGAWMATHPRWSADGPTTLSKDLQGQIKNYGACFDFMVQLQVPQKNMPVEDPTILWREQDSPFLPVARIRIPKQDITPVMQSGFCENLSFTPWHSLPEHKPVGGLNRIRKAVYQGIARYRRCMNGAEFKYAYGEPKNDGSLAFGTASCEPAAPVPLLTGQ